MATSEGKAQEDKSNRQLQEMCSEVEELRVKNSQLRTRVNDLEEMIACLQMPERK